MGLAKKSDKAIIEYGYTDAGDYTSLGGAEDVTPQFVFSMDTPVGTVAYTVCMYANGRLEVRTSNGSMFVQPMTRNSIMIENETPYASSDTRSSWDKWREKAVNARKCIMELNKGKRY